MQVDLHVKSDRSEQVIYNRNDFPVYIRKAILSTYPNYAAISHWHDDVELIAILSGEMHYNVNGRTLLLHTGEGLFVNTRQLHYGYSPDHRECEFICILFHPVLLCSSAYVEQHFIAPVLQNEGFPCLLLQGDNPQANRILQQMQTLLAETASDLFALKTQAAIFDIWQNLFVLSGHILKHQTPRNQHLTLLKDMINEIGSHYPEKLTLEQIAAAGGVSKTTCIHMFTRYTNQTPISYLKEYRLKKSAELLLATDSTMAEICFEVGFSSASYFAELFKKSYHCTPSEYREQMGQYVTDAAGDSKWACEVADRSPK